jgi:hypothetical protein
VKPKNRIAPFGAAGADDDILRRAGAEPNGAFCRPKTGASFMTTARLFYFYISVNGEDSSLSLAEF